MKGILIISPFFMPNVGGVETHLTDLTNSLSRKNYRVFVLTYSPLTTKAKASKFERSRNLEIRRVSWIGGGLFNKLEPFPLLEFFYLTPLLLLKSLLFMMSRGGEIDVIHVHGFNAAMIGKILSILFRKRTVMSSHAIYNIRKGSVFSIMARATLSGYDKILTLSRQSKQELASTGISREKIDVYTYWADLGVFRPLDKNRCKKDLGWQGNFIVLFVGRFIKIKGIELLINVARRNDKICFAFIGDGPVRGLVEREASSMENVIYVGRIPNRELYRYYNASDLLCIPSLYEEGFGRVIIEALACGVPVVGSKRGGIPEAVNSSVGILVEPEEEAVKDAIEYLFKNPDKLEIMKKRCRKYAEQRFGERNIEVIERSYVM
jgi:glycosyltransferase involved in cell wall biosynthesis